MVTRTSKLFDVGTLPELGTLPEKMHAWTLRNERLGDPATAFREEIVPVPEPGDDEIIVANFYAGVNHNGIWAALGKPKNVINENGNFSDPHEDFHICGSEASGIVYDIGKNVTEFQIGDYVTVGAAQYDDNCPLIRAGVDPVNSPTFRVWGYEGNWGSFAQFSKVMTKQCHKIPPTLNMAEAASFTAAGVAVYRMLTHWEGNRIKEGDIVILDSAYKMTPFTPDTNTEKDHRLLINAEVAEWFRDHKVKCVGFGDGVSIENSNEDVKPFHDILMAENIVFLEVLKNLEQLKSDVFFMSYSPLPIHGLDSCPVRAYAIEGLPGFTE